MNPISLIYSVFYKFSQIECKKGNLLSGREIINNKKFNEYCNIPATLYSGMYLFIFGMLILQDFLDLNLKFIIWDIVLFYGLFGIMFYYVEKNSEVKTNG